uniref:Uncharacterized protein n=1 Tax=Hyaloperonospora arabidopsidis (strain Emoy2) TaxID=559515 RepID=M4BQG0_HYAAE
MIVKKRGLLANERLGSERIGLELQGHDVGTETCITPFMIAQRERGGRWNDCLATDRHGLLSAKLRALIRAAGCWTSQ